MEIGEVVEIGDRKVEVTPRREAPQQPAPQPAPERQREKEPS